MTVEDIVNINNLAYKPYTVLQLSTWFRPLNENRPAQFSRGSPPTRDQRDPRRVPETAVVKFLDRPAGTRPVNAGFWSPAENVKASTGPI